MHRFMRHFRLLIILFAIAIIVFITWRSHAVAMYWREATYRTWIGDTDWHEIILRSIFSHRFSEPYVEVDNQVQKFVTPEMETRGFLNWLQNDAIHNPLIGAGLVWFRDSDSLVVEPLSMEIDEHTIRLFHQYVNAVSRSKYHIVNPPFLSTPVIDSLRIEVRRRVGFSLYCYNYVLDYENYPTREKQKEAEKVAFVIIWNSKYYLEKVFPSTVKTLKEDPLSYGMLASDYDIDDYYRGVLLVNQDGDTLLSHGKVQTKRDSLYMKYARMIGYLDRPWDRSPNWGLYVQDHWKNDPGISGLLGDWSPLQAETDEDYWRAALRMMKFRVTLPMMVSAKPTWLLISFSLVVLSLIITVQIIARNRQRDFIAHVSHELRTPVAKVKLFAETLRFDRAVSEEKENEYLDTILRESDHLSVLVDNTLNLARLDAGRMTINRQSADLAEWLKQIFEKQQISLTGSGFSAKLTVESNLPQVKFDPEAMELALNNLIDNAVKYSADRKEIEIHASRTSKNKVRIAVSDRGIGIPVNQRKAIFKRFTRIKSKDREPVGGAGVGLSIVKEIVKRHHGRVWFGAREGGGTIFIVDLPAAS